MTCRFVRVVLAWLLLLALPVQGMAAAGIGACHAGSGIAALQAAPTDSGDPHHHHASHPAPSGDEAAQADAGPFCPACANCGHALALPAARSVVGAAPLPVPSMAGAVPAVAPGDWPVPDKPPRA